MPRLDGWLKNIKLETGFETQDGITRTRTDLFSAYITDGRFEQVTQEPVPESVPAHDARGLLMLPGYADMHCHIDKTFFGDGWQAVITDPSRGLMGFIEDETRMYPTLKTTTEYRASQVLATFIRTGCTRLRTHVDIVKGLKAGHLEGVSRALASFGPAIEHEIVAFPQHGLLRSDSYGSLDEALRSGATLLGGIDPVDMDGDRDRSLGLTMELAVKHDVDIDYHLHEGGEVGFQSYRHFLRLIQEAGLAAPCHAQPRFLSAQPVSRSAGGDRTRAGRERHSTGHRGDPGQPLPRFSLPGAPRGARDGGPGRDVRLLVALLQRQHHRAA